MPMPIKDTLTPMPGHKDTALHQACGKRLRKFRMDKGITMGDMSDLITDRGYHVDQHSYRNWERGALPPIRVLIILNTMGLNLNWYITGKD